MKLLRVRLQSKVFVLESLSSRLAKPKKREFIFVNDHFEGKLNEEIGLYRQTRLKLLQVLLVSIISFNTLLAQTNYSGTINLNINESGTTENVKTIISDIENSKVVFTDTLHAGNIDFDFNITGIEAISDNNNERIISTNIPGFADFNITAYTSSAPLNLDVINSLGQKILCLNSETITSSFTSNTRQSGGATFSHTSTITRSEALTQSQGFTQSHFYVNLSGYNKGVYFFRLHTQNGNALFAKVLKSGENIKGQSFVSAATNNSQVTGSATLSRAPSNTKESQGMTWSHPLTNKMLENENYTISYEQIFSDTDLVRIVNTNTNTVLSPDNYNIINYTAEMIAYPDYSSDISGLITIGDEAVLGNGLSVVAKAVDDANITEQANTNSEGNYSLSLDLEPSYDQPYINAGDRDYEITLSGSNVTTKIKVITVSQETGSQDFNLNAVFKLSGLGNAGVVLKGNNGELIANVIPVDGSYTIEVDSSKTTLNNLQISSEADGYYAKDTTINSINFGQHNIDMSLDEKFIYNYFGLANAPVQVTGDDVDTTLEANGGSYTVELDNKDPNKTFNLHSEADNFYSKDTAVVGKGQHNINMTLDEKFLYNWFGTGTNAENIDLSGEGVDTNIVVTDNSFASKVYDSRDGNKLVNIIASAWGHQSQASSTNSAGSHELNINLNPNQFDLAGTINENEVNMKFIVGEDTVQNEFSYNYTFSKQQIADSIDVKILGEKEWFTDVDTTIKVGPGNNTYNVVMEQNRWPFSISGEGNVRVYLEDSEGKNLGTVDPVAGVWNLDMDTTVNSFDMHIYTDDVNHYNRDTTFVAETGVNNEIDMNADEKFLYKWSGNSTLGANITINGELIDTAFVAGSTYETPTYDSKNPNLVHNVQASKTGYEQIDTATNVQGDHNLELILEENSFSLSGNVNPENVDLIIIANPESKSIDLTGFENLLGLEKSTKDTIFNATTANNYLTQTIQQAADSIDYRIIATASEYITMDTIIRKEPGLQTFDFYLESIYKEVIVKTAVRIDGGDYVLGARVIYEHNSPNGLQRDTSYTDVATSLAIDTIYTSADLSSIKFTRYAEECEIANYNFISDTTENITLSEGVNGPVQVEVNSYNQEEDIVFNIKSYETEENLSGVKVWAEYVAGGIIATAYTNAEGKATLDNIATSTDLKLFAGYETTTDSTAFVWEEVPYTTANEITEQNAKVDWYFWLPKHKQKVPDKLTNPVDSIYLDDGKLRADVDNEANVRRQMGYLDQVFLDETITNDQARVDSIHKWSQDGFDIYNNGEPLFEFVNEAIDFTNPEYGTFDPYTNPDPIYLIGWNIGDGVDNTDPESGIASNGDPIIAGGTGTVSTEKWGVIKELFAQAAGKTNYTNGEPTKQERVDFKLVGDYEKKRYEVETNKDGLYGENSHTPLPKYLYYSF